ncbi:MAG: THUMP domain-containing protein [Acidimicrobiia bacterium]
MDPTLDRHVLHLTTSGDVYLKSRRTQRGLVRTVKANLAKALADAGYDGPIERIGTHRFAIEPDPGSVERVRAAASTVFGIASVDGVVAVPFDDIEDLATSIAALTADTVGSATFAVRVKRSGDHDWTSVDLARLIGARLVETGGVVDLTDPEVEVSVRVIDRDALLVTDHTQGPGGLPLGTQERALSLISGGFDSVVAAWMLMSRGCPVDFVHFTLNCAQSDHALAVACELWKRWGHGTQPMVHLVEFQPVKDALFEHVDPRMRQVILKVLMARAAELIAREAEIGAIVTGDALGQVSSQTLPHLIAVSTAVEIPVLRPLVGLDKEAIIDMARRIGTAELSARAQEVCDLSEGHRVATRAGERDIDVGVRAIPEMVMLDAVATRKSFALRDWSPGGF